MNTTSFLQVRGLTRSFPSSIKAVFEDVAFEIERGSSSASSALGLRQDHVLNILAGLDFASAGR
jgi:ABC-type Na+ transport system ATPase subunit NatA